MNEVIKASLQRIEDANSNIARARAVILMMAEGGNTTDVTPDAIWDSFRLIGDALEKAFLEIDEARYSIADELKTGSTEL